MPEINWQTTYEALRAAATASTNESERIAAQELANFLWRNGRYYDEFARPKVSEIDTMEAAWIQKRAQAYIGIVASCAYLDEVARQAETWELESHPGVPFTTLTDGTIVALAPNRIPAFDDDASLTTASVTLGTSVRLRSGIPGVYGNLLVAAVTASGIIGSQAYFTLEVRFGNAAEYYRHFPVFDSFTYPVTGVGKPSPATNIGALGSVDFLDNTVPPIGVYSFAGGHGNSVTGARERLRRATLLPNLTGDQRETVTRVYSEPGPQGFSDSNPRDYISLTYIDPSDLTQHKAKQRLRGYETDLNFALRVAQDFLSI